MKKLFIWLVFLLFLYFFSPKIIAAAFSFKIASLSTEIISSTEEAILVNLLITDLPGDSYFRVAFQKQNGSPYFGYIKNNLDQWVKVSENCNNFYFINNKSTNELTIPLKIVDYNIESGTYNIKAHRYTSSCNYTSSINSLPIEIIFPSPTPTLTPIATINPTITPLLTPTITPSLTPTPTLTLTTTINPTPTIEPISFNNIFISEAMVNPNHDDKEWIELYNNNDFDVSLENWYLDDVENSGSSPRKFSCFIKTKDYCVIELTSAIFNNSADTVRLLDFNKNLKDDFEYVNSVQGKSYGRINLENNDFCLQEPSKNIVNNQCLTNSTISTTPISSSTTLTSNITKTPIINNKDKSIKPKNNFTKFNYLNKNNYNKKKININNQSGNVLGLANKRYNDNVNQPIKNLIILSISYCFLTIFSILIKIKIIKYEKIKTIFLPFTHSQ